MSMDEERNKAIVRAYMWLFAMLAMTVLFAVYVSRNINQYSRVYATGIHEREASVPWEAE